MGKEERVMNDRLQKLITKIEAMQDVDTDHVVRLVKERIKELQQSGVHSVNKFLQKLVWGANNKEDYFDILMEGRFAVILARNKFSNIHIEYCKKGPDLKADWNRNTVYFEVTRSRPNEEDEQVQSRVAFVSSMSAESIIAKIQGKLRQLKSGEINIVVIWSDTVRLRPPVIKEAFEYIKQEITDELKKYKNLSGILFTEGGGVDTATLKQFYLFKNDKTSKPLGSRFTRKLESLHEQDLKQLQREMDELAAAFRRIKCQ